MLAFLAGSDGNESIYDTVDVEQARDCPGI